MPELHTVLTFNPQCGPLFPHFDPFLSLQSLVVGSEKKRSYNARTGGDLSRTQRIVNKKNIKEEEEEIKISKTRSPTLAFISSFSSKNQRENQKVRKGPFFFSSRPHPFRMLSLLLLL